MADVPISRQRLCSTALRRLRTVRAGQAADPIVVEKCRSAVWCDVNSEAAAKDKRLRMIDRKPRTADELNLERLEWNAVRKRAQTALEGVGLHSGSIAEMGDDVQPSDRAS